MQRGWTRQGHDGAGARRTISATGARLMTARPPRSSARLGGAQSSATTVDAQSDVSRRCPSAWKRYLHIGYCEEHHGREVRTKPAPALPH